MLQAFGMLPVYDRAMAATSKKAQSAIRKSNVELNFSIMFNICVDILTR